MLSERDRLALVEIEHHVISDEQLVRIFTSLTGAHGNTRLGWIALVHAARWATAIPTVAAIPPLWWLALTIAPRGLVCCRAAAPATLLVVALAAHPPPMATTVLSAPTSEGQRHAASATRGHKGGAPRPTRRDLNRRDEIRREEISCGVDGR